MTTPKPPPSARWVKLANGAKTTAMARLSSIYTPIIAGVVLTYIATVVLDIQEGVAKLQTEVAVNNAVTSGKLNEESGRIDTMATAIANLWNAKVDKPNR